MRYLLPALALLAMTGAAHADAIAIPLPEGVTAETTDAVYECGGREIAVTYINAGSISLALLDLEEEQVVASNVVSASGARYAGSHYVWWSTGDEAMFFDIMQTGEDAPTATCTRSD